MKHKHSKFVKKSKKNTKQLSDEQVAKKLLAYVSEMEKYGVTLNALVGTYNSTNAPFVVTNNERVRRRGIFRQFEEIYGIDGGHQSKRRYQGIHANGRGRKQIWAKMNNKKYLKILQLQP